MKLLVAMEGFDRDEDVRVIVLTGKGRAFSAGADIDEMTEDDPISLELLNQFADWDRFALIKKANYRCSKRVCFRRWIRTCTLL